MEATDVEVDNAVMVVVVVVADVDVDMDVAKLEVVMLGVVVPGAGSVEEAVHISTMMHDIGAARHPTSRCSSLT